MSRRLDQKRESKLQPKRYNHAVKELTSRACRLRTRVSGSRRSSFRRSACSKCGLFIIIYGLFIVVCLSRLYTLLTFIITHFAPAKQT